MIEFEVLVIIFGVVWKEVGFGFFYIGSIKFSVGYIEGCFGLVGVFKVIVCLENGMFVLIYGVEIINFKLKFKEWNLVLL